MLIREVICPLTSSLTPAGQRCAIVYPAISAVKYIAMPGEIHTASESS